MIKKRKFLALFMAFTLFASTWLGALPVLASEAAGGQSTVNEVYKDGPDTTPTPEVKTEEQAALFALQPRVGEHESHPVCGATCTHGGSHEAITNWQEWNKTDSLPDGAGNYYLTENVTLSTTWKPADGTKLCLNGCTISADGSSSLDNLISLNKDTNVTFDLCDCQSENGKIDGGNTVVYVDKGTTFNLHSGIITNAKNYGVWVAGGTFNMTGGTIENNKWAGVSQGSTGESNLTGGEISGNKHGGVRVDGNGVKISAGLKLTGNTRTSNGSTIQSDIYYPNAGGGFYPITINPDGWDSKSTDEKIYVDYEQDEKNLPKAFAKSVSENIFKYFTCDEKLDYHVELNGTDLQLAKGKAPEVHTHDGKTFQAWTGTNSLPTTAGYYYLTENIKLLENSQRAVASGETHICLNGHTIDGEVSKHYITGGQTGVYDHDLIEVPNGAKLYLYDYEGGGKITLSNPNDQYCDDLHSCRKINVYDGGELYMDGCTVTGYGQGILIGTDVSGKTGVAKVEITNSKITGNTNSGIYIEGVNSRTAKNPDVKITDTEISNNGTTRANSGIWIENGGTLTVTGGSITGNKASQGGGIRANGGTQAKVTLVGAKITGNTATSSGGGIYVGGSKLSIQGNTEITGNTAPTAAGIYSNVISGNLGLSGTPNITGNTTNAGKQSNLYLLRTSPSTPPNGRFSIASAGVTGGEIGVTYAYIYNNVAQTITYPVTITDVASSNTAYEGYTQYFTSDDESLEVKYNGSINSGDDRGRGLQLVRGAAHTHTGSDDVYTALTASSLPTTAGKYYLKNDVTLPDNTNWTVPTGETTLCLNGHTLTGGIIVPANANFTLCDCTEAANGKISGVFAGVNVRANGTFNMSGGKISGCANGVDAAQNSTINLTGGEISGNTNSGVVINSRANARLAGVKIINNRYEGTSGNQHGVGVVVETGATVTIGSGTVIEKNIYATTNGSGSTISSEWPYDLYLPETFNDIKIDGTLDANTKIGVYYVPYRNMPATKQLSAYHDTAAENAQRFFSDVPLVYHIEARSGVLYLVKGAEPQPPTITTQPIAPTGNNPIGQEIKVEATGTGTLTYQWYDNGENDIPAGDTPSGKPISGATDSSYKISKDLGEGTHYIYCVITDGNGKTTTTKAVKVVIPGDTPSGDEPTITPPTVPTGESPVGKDLTVNVPGGAGTLKYQWYYNTTDSATGGTTTGGNSPTCKIPDLPAGIYYFYCVITDENGKTTTTNTVKIVIPGKDTGDKPTINTQPTAPSVNPGESPVGKDLTVEATTPTGQEPNYQWKYSQDPSGEPSNNVPDANGGKTATCKIPDLEPGTYYFYCEVTDENGNTTRTNIVEITIPEKKGEVLEPGKSITTDDGKTEIKRSDTEENGGDGGKTVTIDKDKTGGKEPDTTITLPENNKDGEVTVDKDTGDVTVPGGSTVKDGDGTGENGKPDVTIGDQGGTVTKDGEVKIPEGGDANVGGTTDPTTGKTTGGTTITGGEGGSTVTPKDDGTVDVSEGGKVKTEPENPSGGENKGTEVTLPEGGNVDPNTGDITPGTNDDGKQIAGVDTDGDGKVDTLVVLPGTGGGDTDGDKIKPNENGGVDVPSGAEIKAGGSEEDKGNGEGGASVTLPDGGEITPGGGVKPEGGNALTGEDKNGDGNPDTEVKLPTGSDGQPTGEIKGNGEGGLDVPGGTTVKNGDDGKEITIGDKDNPTGGNGGTLNNEGGIDLPEGGKATVDNGEDENGQSKPDTTITGGEGGSTITPNDDGTVDVSGGTTVKTGEDGTEITVGDNEGQGGTVNKDGDLELPAGGSATIGGGQDENGNEQPKTEITVPKDTTPGENTTIKDNGDGNVNVPDGSKVKTETPGAGGETQNGTEITLPKGGDVNGDNGAITPGKDDDGKQIAGVDTDGDGKVDTLIVLPDNGGENNEKITPNDKGGVDLPGGTELTGTADGTGNDGGSKVVLGEQGGSANKDGGVDLPKDGTATVENGSGEKTEITAGENGGSVKPNQDGKTDVAGNGTKVQIGGEESGKPAVTVDDKGAAVTPEGNIDIKDGASVTVGGEDGKPGTTITAPGGKDDGNGGTTAGSTTVKPNVDGSVDVGEGGTVSTGGANGESGTPVTLPDGGKLNPSDGTVTPEGGKIATGEDKDGDGIPDTIIILPEDKPAITPNDQGGITLPGGSTIKGGEGSPDITLPEGSKIDPDGNGVQPGSNNITIKGEENQPDIAVTLPDGGVISSGENGGLQVPAGTEIKQDGENTPSVVVGEKGGTIGGNGSVTLPEDGSVKIDGTEIKTPEGGKVSITDGSTTAPVIEINGIVITAPADDEVSVDRNGNTPLVPGTVITKPGDGAGNGVTVKVNTGNPTVNKDGILTFPNGGEIEITKDGKTEIRVVPAGGTIDINTLGGNNPSKPSISGGHSGGGGGGSTTAPTISAPGGHGTASVNPTRPQPGDTVTITPKPDKGYVVDEVTVTDKDGKPVSVQKKPDGKYTFTQPEKGKVKIEITFRPETTEPTKPNGNTGSADYKNCAKGADCPMYPFTDAQTSAWYHDGVHYCLANNIMNGVSATMFAPNENTTRAQIVTIIYRAEGEPATSGSNFADVSENQYYAKAVAWAAANGIVKGYSETQFAPDDNVTREQLAAILYRYAQFKGQDISVKGNLAAYADNNRISEYAYPAMEWAVGSGLMNGNDDGTLNPLGQATRAEVAVMLMRFLNK